MQIRSYKCQIISALNVNEDDVKDEHVEDDDGDNGGDDDQDIDIFH